MAKANFSDRINDLFRQDEWEKARQLLERERQKDPHDHWLLTQLGVTFYEQKRYEESLQLFLASLRIVADCPLTLWHLAGTLDALGKHTDAWRIYTWLLESKRSPEEDPCWETQQWADSLKTDTVYRLGVCFQNLGKRKEAEDCYRQYLNLLLIGADGTYSIEEVTHRIRGLHGADEHGSMEEELRKAVTAALQASGSKPKKGRRNVPPSFDERKLLAGRRAANKK
jgi:tetratricopeptide (TPR) repeat protein